MRRYKIDINVMGDIDWWNSIGDAESLNGGSVRLGPWIDWPVYAKAIRENESEEDDE